MNGREQVQINVPEWSHKWGISLTIYDEDGRHQYRIDSDDHNTLAEALDSLNQHLLQEASDEQSKAERIVNRIVHESAQLSGAIKELSDWRENERQRGNVG